jgi:DDE_Tnp_1-associated
LGITDSTHGFLDAVGGKRGMEEFGACFEELDDPRTGNAGRHDLLEILMIALCAVLCGGQTAVDIRAHA